MGQLDKADWERFKLDVELSERLKLCVSVGAGNLSADFRNSCNTRTQVPNFYADHL